jgi:hypothetical protein
MSRPVTLPSALRERLAALAARTRRLRAVRGVSVLILFLVLTAGAALTADYFLDLPSLVRRVIFVSWASIGVGLLCHRFLLPVLRRLDHAALAAAVEETYPALNERLSTTVGLAGKADDRQGAAAFLALVVEDTERLAKPFDFLSAVPSRPVVSIAAAAMAAMVLLLSPAVAWPGEYSDLVHRFLLPWNDLSPYLLAVNPGHITAARGSSVTIDVTVQPRSARVRLPAAVSLVTSDAAGTETAQRMRVDRSDAFSLPLVVTSDGYYRIEVRAAAGDSPAASETYQVTAVTQVELLPDSPAITVTPPAYARGTRDEETLSGLVDLIALQGSQVRFELRFTRPAVAARMEWAGTDAKTKEYPLTLADENRAAALTLPATATGNYRLILEAEHGVCTQLEGGTLTVKSDQPPAVTKFRGGEELKAVTPYDKIALECNLVDDVGVARADVEYRINDGKPAREPFPLTGAGRLEASGQLLFALDGKVKEGDTISYRLRVEDNLPKELKGPHVVYAPAEQWLSLKVDRQPGPLREQEIASQRDAVDRRIEAIRQALLQEMRGLYKLKLESRVDPALTPEQRDALASLEGENQNTEKSIREMVREVEANPVLQPLAEKARSIADREMQQSEAALHGAGTARMPPIERDSRFAEADHRLDDAEKKLDELKKRNEQIARDRADQLRFEALAEKQQKLAEKAAELAQKDPARDPSVKEQAEQLRREQAETADELQRLADKSPLLQKALDQARAEQAKQAADRARELANAQRTLARAKADAETDRKTANLTDLAEKQRALAEKAARLADETKQPARSASLQPLRADDARRATDALKDGDAKEAIRLQEALARNLDRLADGLDRAMELSRDPREAARQLARLQDDLRQRVQDEKYRKNADLPLADRLADLVREQEAIRKKAETLSVPPDDETSRKNRQTAVEKADLAADKLRGEEVREALGPMEQTRRALETLAKDLPPLDQRQQRAIADVSRLRQEQEQIARQAEQVARDLKGDDSAKARESAKQRLGEIAKRQAELLKDLKKVDPATREARRERAAQALNRALADLQNGLPEDAGASQQEAKRELERLEQALAGKKPADELARELAKRQGELAADAGRGDKLTPPEKSDIRRKQQDLTNEVVALPAPEAPERQSEAERAARAAAKQVEADPASPQAREAMEESARMLGELAKQMSGRESDAARADRLARRQSRIAAEAEKQLKENPDKSQPADLQRSQDEIAREAEQLPGGEQGQTAKRNAERALDQARTAVRPLERVQAQKQAATSLRELADRIAARKDETKPDEAAPRADAAPESATPGVPGLPTRQQSEQARQLASQERQLRDAVRKAGLDDQADKTPPSKDPLGELAKRQTEVARQSAELSRDVTREQGEQSALSRQGEKTSGLTREAADKMQNGELPGARQAGKQAADNLRQLAEDLSGTPRAERENPDNDQLRRSRDLARQQEDINRRSAELAADTDARRARQRARQQELGQQTGELAKDLDRLRDEMNRTPQAGAAAGEAARAARSAQQKMEQSGEEDSARAGRSQEQAARSLDSTAQQADRAASEQAAATDGRSREQQGSSKAGQSVSQARSQMAQAQGQLGLGEPGQARESMENAARSLRQAASQLAQGAQQNSTGNPESSNSPGLLGPAPAGRPDASLFGPGVAKYAGKTWGELPGELRTKIVQDMKVKYGEDYARMIKLYFEQLADTKREEK